MRRFLFLRHCLTEANARAVICGGEYDAALSPEGESQQERLVAFVTNSLQVECSADPAIREKPLGVCSSHLQRASGFAQNIVSTHSAYLAAVSPDSPLPILSIDPMLRERDQGAWNNQPQEEIYARLKQGEEPPGGECEADFRLRVRGTLQWLFSLPFENTVVITSKGVLRVIYYLCSGLVSWQDVQTKTVKEHRIAIRPPTSPPHLDGAHVDGAHLDGSHLDGSHLEWGKSASEIGRINMLAVKLNPDDQSLVCSHGLEDLVRLDQYHLGPDQHPSLREIIDAALDISPTHGVYPRAPVPKPISELALGL